MGKDSDEKGRLRMLSALATVSSLGMMIVGDFMLAYYGGNWLDEYFATGDHRIRLFCICLAIVTVFLTFFRLIRTALPQSDRDEQ